MCFCNSLIMIKLKQWHLPRIYWNRTMAWWKVREKYSGEIFSTEIWTTFQLDYKGSLYWKTMLYKRNIAFRNHNKMWNGCAYKLTFRIEIWLHHVLLHLLICFNHFGNRIKREQYVLHDIINKWRSFFPKINISFSASSLALLYLSSQVLFYRLSSIAAKLRS